MDHQGVAGVRSKTTKNHGDDPKLEPYWWEQAPRPELPSPAVPARIDVAIVGSGYAGLTAAITLARAGRKIALRVLGSPEAANIFDTLNHPTRPLYFGRPWFLPPILTYYGWRDGLRL